MPKTLSPAIRNQTLSIIMGGGQGSRLSPLTDKRSKPAVPLGGKYRLVDIPISNCLNSGLRQIYVLTQFNTESLHRHITEAYKFDSFSSAFVRILAAQQTPGDEEWYQGTADAVRQNLSYFLSSETPFKYFIILSGDQLYRMDCQEMLAEHIANEAELTIATTPVDRENARAFGLMHTDDEGKITRFEEKPGDNDALLDELTMPKAMLKKSNIDPNEERFQASMGIYIFNRQALIEALDNDFQDFGKHVIPQALEQHRNVYSYIFQDYWEDIGTVGSFHQANIALADDIPNFNFFDGDNPIYSRARFLPPSKVNGANVKNALISDGCIIEEGYIERSIVGLRTIVRKGSKITSSVIMGADYYKKKSIDEKTGEMTTKPIQIGENVTIDNAIIDKNVCIGDNVSIEPRGRKDGDYEWCCIRDGVVVVSKSSCIPSNTEV